MMKKLLAILMVLALLAPAALAEIRHESEGYDSPEAAVEAYVEALNRGDVDDMIAAFAIESFVDRCDAETALQYLQSINPMLLAAVPVNGAYSRSLLINARRAQIANRLFQQYIQISAQLDNMAVPLQESAERQEMLEKFANSPANAWEGNVELVGWVNPALLSDKIAYFHGKDRHVNDTMGCAVGDGEIDWPLFLGLYHRYNEGVPFILEYVKPDNMCAIRDRVLEYDRQAVRA